MGLLDDAIREHLELKRRRGADPAAVARAEQEALGPVRREPDPAAVAEDRHDDAHEEHDAPRAAAEEPRAHDDADVHDDEPRAQAPEVSEDQTRIILPDERPPAPARAEPEADASDEAAPAAERTRGDASEPAATAPADAPDAPVDPRHSDIVHQPTTEYSIEDLEDEDMPFSDPPPSRSAKQQGEDENDTDEDVLEETPDFLQETPEHDRLWFEQRPPRDFDFDD